MCVHTCTHACAHGHTFVPEPATAWWGRVRGGKCHKQQTERESMRRGRERDGLPVEQCTSASTCSWMEEEEEEEEEEERCRGYTCHMHEQTEPENEYLVFAGFCEVLSWHASAWTAV